MGFDAIFKGDDWRGTPKALHWNGNSRPSVSKLSIFLHTRHLQHPVARGSEKSVNRDRRYRVDHASQQSCTKRAAIYEDITTDSEARTIAADGGSFRTVDGNCAHRLFQRGHRYVDREHRHVARRNRGQPPPPGVTEDRAENISTLPPVPINQPSPLSNGLEVTAVSAEPLELTANGPGEITGSGLSVTLDFVNKSTVDISLDSLTVNAFYSDGLPGCARRNGYSHSCRRIAPPGEHRQGVYVFQIPADGLDSAVFEVGHSDSQNVIAVTR